MNTNMIIVVARGWYKSLCCVVVCFKCFNPSVTFMLNKKYPYVIQNSSMNLVRTA